MRNRREKFQITIRKNKREQIFKLKRVLAPHINQQQDFNSYEMPIFV